MEKEAEEEDKKDCLYNAYYESCRFHLVIEGRGYHYMLYESDLRKPKSQRREVRTGNTYVPGFEGQLAYQLNQSNDVMSANGELFLWHKDDGILYDFSAFPLLGIALKQDRDADGKSIARVPGQTEVQCYYGKIRHSQISINDRWIVIMQQVEGDAYFYLFRRTQIPLSEFREGVLLTLPLRAVRKWSRKPEGDIPACPVLEPFVFITDDDNVLVMLHHEDMFKPKTIEEQYMIAPIHI